MRAQSTVTLIAALFVVTGSVLLGKDYAGQALDAYNQRNFSRAVDLYSKATASSPDTPEHFLNLGLALKQAGKLDRAQVAFLQADWRIRKYVKEKQERGKKLDSRLLNLLFITETNSAWLSGARARAEHDPIRRLWFVERARDQLIALKQTLRDELTADNSRYLDSLSTALLQEREQARKLVRQTVLPDKSPPLKFWHFLEPSVATLSSKDVHGNQNSKDGSSCPDLWKARDLLIAWERNEHPKTLDELRERIDMVARLRQTVDSALMEPISKHSLIYLWAWLDLTRLQANLWQQMESLHYEKNQWQAANRDKNYSSINTSLLKLFAEQWLPRQANHSRPEPRFLSSLAASYPGVAAFLKSVNVRERIRTTVTDTFENQDLIDLLKAGYRKNGLEISSVIDDGVSVDSIPNEYFLANLDWSFLKSTNPIPKAQGGWLSSLSGYFRSEKPNKNDPAYQWNDGMTALLEEPSSRKLLAELTRQSWALREQLNSDHGRATNTAKLDDKWQSKIKKELDDTHLKSIDQSVNLSSLSLDTKPVLWAQNEKHTDSAESKEENEPPRTEHLSDEDRYRFILEWIRTNMTGTDLYRKAYASLLKFIVKDRKQLTSRQLSDLHSALEQNKLEIDKLVFIMESLELAPEYSEEDTNPLLHLIPAVYWPKLLPADYLDKLETYRKKIFSEHFPEQSKESWELASRLFENIGIPSSSIGKLAETQHLLDGYIDKEQKRRLILDLAKKAKKGELGREGRVSSASAHANNRAENAFNPSKRLLPFHKLAGSNSYNDANTTSKMKPNGDTAIYEPRSLSFFAPLSVSLPGRDGVVEIPNRPVDPPVKHADVSANDFLVLTQATNPEGLLLVPWHSKPDFLIQANELIKAPKELNSDQITYSHPSARRSSTTVVLSLRGNKAVTGYYDPKDLEAFDKEAREFYLGHLPDLNLTYSPELTKLLDELREIINNPGSKTRWEAELLAVDNLRRWIGDRSEYRIGYSLDLPAFNKTLKGDCKVGNAYFAYLVAKELGIPTRLTEGYLARQGKIPFDGHVNVEVWNSHEGWHLIDATPPAKDDKKAISQTQSWWPINKQAYKHREHKREKIDEDVKNRIRICVKTGIEEKISRVGIGFLSEPVLSDHYSFLSLLGNNCRFGFSWISEKQFRDAFSVPLNGEKRNDDAFVTANLLRILPVSTKSDSNALFWQRLILRPEIKKSLSQFSYHEKRNFFTHVLGPILNKLYFHGTPPEVMGQQQVDELWSYIECFKDDMPFSSLLSLIDLTFDAANRADFERRGRVSRRQGHQGHLQQDKDEFERLFLTGLRKRILLVAPTALENLKKAQLTPQESREELLQMAIHGNELLNTDRRIKKRSDDEIRLKIIVERGVREAFESMSTLGSSYFEKFQWALDDQDYKNHHPPGNSLIHPPLVKLAYRFLLEQAKEGKLNKTWSTHALSELDQDARYELIRTWALSNNPRLLVDPWLADRQADYKVPVPGGKLNDFLSLADLKHEAGVKMTSYTSNHISELFRILDDKALGELQFLMRRHTEALRKTGQTESLAYKKSLLLLEIIRGCIEENVVRITEHWEDAARALAEELPEYSGQDFDDTLLEVIKPSSPLKPSNEDFAPSQVYKMLGRLLGLPSFPGGHDIELWRSIKAGIAKQSWTNRFGPKKRAITIDPSDLNQAYDLIRQKAGAVSFIDRFENGGHSTVWYSSRVHNLFNLMRNPDSEKSFHNVLQVALSSRYFANEPKLFLIHYVGTLREGENKSALKEIPTLLAAEEKAGALKEMASHSDVRALSWESVMVTSHLAQLLSHARKEDRLAISKLLNRYPTLFSPLAQSVIAYPPDKLVVLAEELSSITDAVLEKFGDQEFSIPLHALHDVFESIRDPKSAPKPVALLRAPKVDLSKFPESELAKTVASFRRLETTLKHSPNPTEATNEVLNRANSTLAKLAKHDGRFIPIVTDIFGSLVRIASQVPHSTGVNRNMINFFRNSLLSSLSSEEKPILGYLALKYYSRFSPHQKKLLRESISDLMIDLKPPHLEWMLEKFWTDSSLNSQPELTTLITTETLRPETAAKLVHLDNEHVARRSPYYEKATETLAMVLAGDPYVKQLAAAISKKSTPTGSTLLRQLEEPFEEHVYPLFPDKHFAKRVIAKARQQPVQSPSADAKLLLFASANGLVGLNYLDRTVSVRQLADVPESRNLLKLSLIATSMNLADQKTFEQKTQAGKTTNAAYSSPSLFSTLSLEEKLKLIESDRYLVPLDTIEFRSFNHLVEGAAAVPQRVSVPTPER